MTSGQGETTLINNIGKYWGVLLTQSMAQTVELDQLNKALRAENEALRAENEALRAENEALRAENEALRAEIAEIKEEKIEVAGS
jgi:cell division protein FtsB